MKPVRKSIAPRELKLGMFVHGFEGSWFSHPFWRAGFEVRDEATLNKIRESAVGGVIVEWIAESDEPPVPSPAQQRSPDDAAAVMRRAMQTLVPHAGHQAASEASEIEQAKATMKRARAVVVSIFEQARLGRAIKGSEVAAVVDDVSEAVLRNPSAMIKVARLKSKNEYTYMHSLAVCTLMVNFARTLNLPESTYRPLGMAGLLHDVGKLAVDDDILDKPGSLTPAEFEEIKLHTVRGRDLLADSSDVPAAALDVCLHHHERMNGTGYPFGLSADQISLEARMGAICDIYDALTSDRPYKKSWTPVEALQAMESWEGHLDPELLFRFMQSIGIFVPGTLVELRSRRLAVILPQGPRTGVMQARAFFDMRARDFMALEDVRLGDSLRFDQAMRVADPQRFGFTDWTTMQTMILTGGDPRRLAHKAA